MDKRNASHTAHCVPINFRANSGQTKTHNNPLTSEGRRSNNSDQPTVAPRTQV